MKIFVKPYSPSVLSGPDFPQTATTNLRRLVFSPDNAHSVSVVALRDGALLLTNEKEVEFDFSITRNNRVVAVVRYRKHATSLIINNNWLLTQDGIENRAINENPDLIHSDNLNIEIPGYDILRVDFKVHESSIACAVFNDRDLLFVRMNGHHVYPRLTDYIANRSMVTNEKVETFLDEHEDFEKGRVELFLRTHQGYARALGQRYFQEVAKGNAWFSK